MANKVKQFFDEVVLFLALYFDSVSIVGWILLVAPSVYDFLMVGVRGFEEWSIGYKGILIMWLGAGIIWLSKKSKDMLR